MLLAVAVTVLVADIASKAIVVATLSGRPPVRLLGGLLTLRVDRNPGAAFSIGTSMTIVFTAIAVGGDQVHLHPAHIPADPQHRLGRHARPAARRRDREPD